jgi:hypothetical protein
MYFLIIRLSLSSTDTIPVFKYGTDGLNKGLMSASHQKYPSEDVDLCARTLFFTLCNLFMEKKEDTSIERSPEAKTKQCWHRSRGEMPCWGSSASSQMVFFG